MEIIQSLNPIMILDIIFEDKERLKYAFIMTSFFTIIELLYLKNKDIKQIIISYPISVFSRYILFPISGILDILKTLRVFTDDKYIM